MITQNSSELWMHLILETGQRRHGAGQIFALHAVRGT